VGKCEPRDSKRSERSRDGRAAKWYCRKDLHYARTYSFDPARGSFEHTSADTFSERLDPKPCSGQTKICSSQKLFTEYY
jgi:hypothetical protein